MAEPDVGVVTVNYNCGKYLFDCVDSVLAAGVTDIVCVDNGSNDGSPEQLIEKHPDVALIRLPNPGFGAANNAGAKHLRNQFAFALNPDTVLPAGVVEGLHAAMESDPKIAIVGPRVLNVDGTTYPSARAFPKMASAIGHAVVGAVYKGNPWTKRYHGVDTPADELTEVDWVSGSAMFIRREAFESVGGFDEGYFMYMEDTDLCWRLRQAGWKIAYEPRVALTHVGGVSTSKRAYRMLKAHHESAIRYANRTTTGRERLLLPVVAGGLMGRLLAAWLSISVKKGVARARTSEAVSSSLHRARALTSRPRSNS